MIKKWNLIKENKVFSSKPFNVYKKIYEKPEKRGKFSAFVIQTPDWANIIVRNKKKEILLIRQFRFGSDKVELEIPGGCIDSDEAPIDGARRELKEETGYISNKFQQIGVVDANPAIQSNKCYTFLAENITNTGIRNLDPDEDLECQFYPMEDVQNFIRDGKITNTYIIAAFHWLSLYEQK
ncbi:hypothetical protein NEF87_003349 [Candidatus Lokiarchaeum ossiferum]|uniref:Nudix hydrolase domain-containing protein n=1 Tax=Candidatus Lokiarchaeum ossiferum TaxID=2951803 RepID=A0ABY6HU70_9ARCH|nr:hypothetical protein NEF87_003349 [Candidatus Lokiarchaeum sp. B-35]